MIYTVGQHVPAMHGYVLPPAYERTCPDCGVRRHTTRAVEDDEGRQQEIVVCGSCGRIQRVSSV